MNKLTAFFLLLSANCAHAACSLPQGFWDWPRSAEAVLAAKEIRPCIETYLAVPASKLVIRHGTDDESILHADEMRAWLVSLAVSPSRIADARGEKAGISIETLRH